MIIAQSLSLLFSRPSPPSLSSAVLRSDMDTVRDGPTWGLWRLELAIAVCLALLMAGAGLIVDADDERAVEDRTAASKGNGPDGGESQPLLQDDSPHPAVAGRHDGRPEHYGSSRRADDDDNGKRRATQLGIKEVFSGDLRYGGMSYLYRQQRRVMLNTSNHRRRSAVQPTDHRYLAGYVSLLSFHLSLVYQPSGAGSGETRTALLTASHVLLFQDPEIDVRRQLQTRDTEHDGRWYSLQFPPGLTQGASPLS